MPLFSAGIKRLPYTGIRIKINRKTKKKKDLSPSKGGAQLTVENKRIVNSRRIVTVCLSGHRVLESPTGRVDRSSDLGLTFQCPPRKGFRGKTIGSTVPEPLRDFVAFVFKFLCCATRRRVRMRIKSFRRVPQIFVARLTDGNE